MGKTELVAHLAEEVGMTKKDAELAVNLTLEWIGDELKKGEKISFVGFGSFDVRERAAREGINPQTGKKIKIPASKSVGFKVGKKLKEKVN